MSTEKIINDVAAMLILNSPYKKHFGMLSTPVDSRKWDDIEGPYRLINGATRSPLPFTASSRRLKEPLNRVV